MAAGALILPVAVADLASAPGGALLWTVLLLIVAGLFDFLSRSKKKERASGERQESAEGNGEAPDGEGEEAGDADPAAADDLQEAAPSDGAPARPQKKGAPPPRPKPRRSDYTGDHVRVFVPGRPAEAPAPAPSKPPPAEEKRDAAPDKCPGCGKCSTTPGQFCADCSARDQVAEAAKLVSSLKTKEVLVLPAERYLFQARSALAVSAYSDVERLCAQATSAARDQEADFEESQGILSRCEETIAKAIDAGRNTLAAEKAFEKATGLFMKGRYTESMEEAVIIPTLIMDRPRPTIIPVGKGPPAGEAPVPPGGEASHRSSLPEPPAPAPGAKPPAAPPEGAPAAHTGKAAPEGDNAAPKPPVTAMVRCPSCGHRCPAELEDCPACKRPLSEPGEQAPAGAPACGECGEPLEPAWKVCPGCGAPAGEPAGHASGNCPVCGREVLPMWSICPYCDSRLKPNAPAMKVKKGFTRPERPGPTIPPALREKGVLSEIEEVDRMLDEAADRGLDVKKARNLLELALTFARSGNYDKGERYVRKARNVAETLLSLPFNRS